MSESPPSRGADDAPPPEEAEGLDLARRLEFLAFGPDDEAAVRELGMRLAPHQGAVVRAFSDHLTRFGATREFLRDPATRTRLEAEQLAYFTRLTRGGYDEAYAKAARRVGIVHQRVGLDPEWYMGSYRVYLDEVVRRIPALYPGDPEGGARALVALVKVIFLDMGLALDAFVAADHRALAAREAHHRRLLETTPLGVLVVDEALNVVQANTAAMRILELGLSELVGRIVTDLLPVAGLRGHLLEVLTGGEPKLGLRLETPAGHAGHRSLRATMAALGRDPEGGGLRGLLLLDDVTDEEQARAQAAQATMRFQEVIERAGDGIVLLDAAGLVTYFNRAAEVMLGLPRARVLGRPFGGLLGGPGAHAHREAMERFAACGDTAGLGQRRRVEGRRPDGQVVPMECNLSACTIDGQPTFVAILRDLSEQEAQAAALASTQRSLVALLERSPDAVGVHRDGRFVYVNPALVEVLGYLDASDLVGAPVLSQVHPSDRETMIAELANLDRRGQAGPPKEVRFLRRDGEIVHGEIVSVLMEFEGAPAIMTTGRDLTERRRRDSAAMQQDRMVAVGTLAAGIAHEINTPVQFVSDSVHFLQEAAEDTFALVEALQRLRHLVQAGADRAQIDAALAEVAEAEEIADLEYLGEHVPRAFQRTADGIARVAKIVRSMKAFAHPSGGELSPANLNEAVEQTLTIARNEYKYVAELEMELGELPPVHCYLDEVNQVVLNLVVNAAHAIADAVEGTDTRGRLGVRTYVDGKYAVIEVSDTGTGIPEGVRERIFEPFFTTKQVGKGTGQGLALAWQVIHERHKGSLTFDSKLGRGTTFHVRLPIEGPAREGESGSAAEADPPPARREAVA